MLKRNLGVIKKNDAFDLHEYVLHIVLFYLHLTDESTILLTSPCQARIKKGQSSRHGIHDASGGKRTADLWRHGGRNRYHAENMSPSTVLVQYPTMAEIHST